VTEPAEQDAALVTRALAGSEAAFRELVDRHYANCGRFAYRLLGQRQDAEDAVQETFVRMHHALNRYDERNTFRAWLYRILVRSCGNVARGRSRRWRRFVSVDAVEHPAAPAADGALRDALQRALELVDAPLREAFLLKYAEGFEYTEIAAITGASVPALKMRVMRARDAMRPALEEWRHE
jgi:RNA polymerase sigma-70 factor (ECF subfamily)